MATESFKILEASFEAWNRRDFDAVLDNFSEEVVWRPGIPIPDVDPVYEGREGVRRFFAEFMEPWEEISIEIEDVIEDREDQIVLLVRFQARGREGIEVDGRFFHIYRQDQRHQVTEFQAFEEADRNAAMEEAGLDG